ncbi:hypothetical protein Taro_007384 [Colocasia esculenta]|uniref:Uncharacterized protein n=1 Tax=Colocasia esculenta TaxID=4460 RepID=A0A843TR65_COLES|nr:hypothetical protein [Colocasia esculenta]
MCWCHVGGARRDSHPCCGELVGHVLVVPWFSVAPGQQAVTVFCHVALSGRLMPVSMAGVSVRPVALSRHPWAAHPRRGPLTRRVKVVNATGRCRVLKAQAGYPFPLSLLLPFSLSLRRPLPPLFSPLCVSGCSCCCAACVVSVVARLVRAVAARLALDSLAVAFLVWRTLASQSRRGGGLCVVSWCRGVCVERGGGVHSDVKGPSWVHSS